MKELLLLRHAKSSWDNAHLADYDRPLNGRGLDDARRMGRLLRLKDLVPDWILCSAAVRAAITAELVAESMGYEGEIRTTQQLYLAEPDSYLLLLRKTAAQHQRVLAVGHNPGLEELVEMLSGHWERMPTGAIAHFQLAIKHWGALDSSTPATLLDVWRPRNIPR
jgi:phosphohistidine phosphatase